MRGAAAILCIAVAICGLGIKGGAQLADSSPVSFNLKDYPTISFNLNGATCDKYKYFIGELRKIVERGATSTRSGTPALRPAKNVQVSERFVLVRLTDYSGAKTATVAVDVVNLYVVAFLVNDRAFFFSDATPLQKNNLFVGTRRTFLTYSGSYIDLERLAKQGREKIGLGPTPLGKAITGLGASNKRTRDSNERTRARSIIVVIQMVSEAARFGHIEIRILESIDGNTFFPNPRILSMENKWSAMSLEIQRSVDGLNFNRSIRLNDEHGKAIDVRDFKTLRNLTRVALLLYRCPMPTAAHHVDDDIIRMPVAHHDETCDIEEPTKRISGRDGLCVDVRDGGDNDGNPIQLWQCGEQRNQQWTFHRDGTIRSMGKCMTTYGYSSGNYVMIFNCSTAVVEATKWTVSVDGTITNPPSGLVLTAPQATAGTTLVVGTNAHDATQGWTVGNEETIVTYILGMNMMCLEAKNENSALWLEDCALNRGQQKWALYSDGTIRVDSDRSFCVTSRSGVSRATIVILKCQGLATQRWVFNNTDRTILSPNSKLVMDVKGSDVSLREIILYPPTGNPNQQWLTHTNPFE